MISLVIITTSNVTARHHVRSESFGLITERHHYNGQAGYQTPSLNRRHVPSAGITTHMISCDAFSSSSVVSRTFSALYVYSKFGHHPRPLG